MPARSQVPAAADLCLADGPGHGRQAGQDSIFKGLVAHLLHRQHGLQVARSGNSCTLVNFCSTSIYIAQRLNAPWQAGNDIGEAHPKKKNYQLMCEKVWQSSHLHIIAQARSTSAENHAAKRESMR
jgi:hypothetical protein